MTLISYAQNLEDVLLSRVFQNVQNGSYVDVGACHPEQLSVTKTFYDRGWRGINIEPGVDFTLFASQRPRDTNLNVAISETPRNIDYTSFPMCPALSGVNAKLPESLRQFAKGSFTQKIAAIPLVDVFAEYWPERGVEFMSIDVEQHELQVLSGNDWSRFRPQVILIESTLPNTRIPCFQAWEHILTQAAYRFAYFDGLNRFYVADEASSLLSAFEVPVCIHDDYTPATALRWREEAQHSQQEAGQLRQELEQLYASMGGRGSKSFRLGVKLARKLAGIGRYLKRAT